MCYIKGFHLLSFLLFVYISSQIFKSKLIYICSFNIGCAVYLNLLFVSMCVCIQFADGVYLILLMGLLEDYFVPLYNFFLTPESFEQKVISVSKREMCWSICIFFSSILSWYIVPPSGPQCGVCLWADAGRRPEETQSQTRR